MTGGCLPDARGLTLIEILIALSVFLILLFAVYSTFESSWRTYEAGAARADVQQNARVAMELLETDLRLAGYGFPPGAGAITAATPTAITFWADLTNGSTRLATDVNAGDTTLAVENAAGIRAGDLIYLINGGLWEQQIVQAVTTGATPNTITITTGATAFYPWGAQIGRPKSITYSWTTNMISLDDGQGGGLQPLADGVQAFQIRYFDSDDVEIPPGNLAASLANIRRSRITLTVQSPAGLMLQTFTMTSDVRARNL